MIVYSKTGSGWCCAL